SRQRARDRRPQATVHRDTAPVARHGRRAGRGDLQAMVPHDNRSGQSICTGRSPHRARIDFVLCHRGPLMKSYSANTVAALAARRLLPRDFLTITARERDTGEPVTVGFWSDLANVTALVIDPETGDPDLRAFYGAGSL